MKNKRSEEISLVKKYALYSLFYLIKRQHSMLQEFPPVDAPKELFTQYIITAYELKAECDKSVEMYENLLTRWELETIKQLQLSVTALVNSVGISQNRLELYTPDSFDSYFENKRVSAAQNEKINVFLHCVQTDIEKYSKEIKQCFDVFKLYL